MSISPVVAPVTVGTSTRQSDTARENRVKEVVRKGVDLGLLTHMQGLLIFQSLDKRDKIVPETFSAGGKNFEVFLELMELDVWSILKIKVEGDGIFEEYFTHYNPSE